MKNKLIKLFSILACGLFAVGLSACGTPENNNANNSSNVSSTEISSDMETNSSHEHSFDIKTTDPTCISLGYTRYICNECGYSYDDDFQDMTEHSPVIDKGFASTCLASGLTDGSHCGYCGITLDPQQTIDPSGHDEAILIGSAATCELQGLTDGIYCKACNITLVAQEPIQATGHQFGDWYETKAATEQKEGIKQRDCSNCSHFESSPIAVLTHSHDRYTPTILQAVAATCMESGLTEGKKCSGCNEILIAQEVIPAKGHKEEILPAVEATCKDPGLTEGKRCSVCKTTFVAQTVIPATENHKLDWFFGVPPTCTEPGVSGGQHCTICKTIFSGNKPLPPRHTEVIDAEVIPTCTKTGLTEGRHCSACGEVMKAQEVVAARGHTEITYPAVAPTCTRDGCTEWKYCRVCRENTVERIILPAFGHSEIILPAVEPTCTKTGLTEGKYCTTCKTTTVVQQNRSRLPHSYLLDVPTQTYLKSSASCKKKAVYYKSCQCGAKGSETFEYGDFVHIYYDGWRYSKTHCWRVSECCNKIDFRSEHTYVNGFCSDCTMPSNPTTGISYALSTNQAYAIVTGYTGAANIVRIATTYNGVPVKEIADGAFSSATMEGILIPEGVTKIGASAFSDTQQLHTIILPQSLTHIGESAFKMTGGLNRLNHVFYCGTIANWCSISFADEKANPFRLASTNLYIDDTVVTEVTVPNSVNEIKPYVFANYVPLTNLVIENGVTDIGTYAFYSCKGLKSITMANSITSIANNAFAYCSALDNTYITDLSSWCNISFATEGSNPLYYTKNLYVNNELVTHLVIPNTVTAISSYAFSSFKGFDSITIPSSVTSIGNWAFNKCTYLKNVYISDLAAWCTISFKDFLANPLYYAKSFYVNNQLTTDLVIPDGVKSINNYAFAYFEGFNNISISNSVKYIYNYAFSQCGQITNFTLGTAVSHIGQGAFTSCKFTNVYINDLAKWCSLSFKDPYGNRTLNNPIALTENLYVNNVRTTNLVIPEGVTSIPQYAFYECALFDSITLPSTLAFIQSYSFTFNMVLKQINFPSSLQSIGSDAFLGCTGLTSITIPNSVTSIGNNAFLGCTGLTDVTLSNSLKWLNTSVFSGCTGLKKISIPSSATSINNSAFSGCTSLTSIEIPDSVNTIGTSAFSGCSSLTSIEIPDSVNTIGASAFSGCSSLTSIVLPSLVTTINANTFSGCTNLTTVTLGSNVTEIKQKAFLNCSKLSSIVIPATVTQIGENAFSGCSALTSVQFVNPETWYVNDLNLTTFTKEELSNVGTAASYLTNTYVGNLWKKKN